VENWGKRLYEVKSAQDKVFDLLPLHYELEEWMRVEESGLSQWNLFFSGSELFAGKEFFTETRKCKWPVMYDVFLFIYSK